VQRRYGAFVYGIGIRSGFDQEGDDRCLRSGIPRRRTRGADSSGVQGLIAQTVFRVDIRARSD